MSLYNKYRPTTFDSMVGDYSYFAELLKSPTHNHFMLFTGNPGTGKTTASRIVANMLGAVAMDIVEVNCSNKTGVDDMREIIESTYNLPLGKCMVVILDEAHRLTNQAQESLNKPLEDVPKHCYWIMTTSHPEKLADSIKTRACKIHFQDLTSEELYKLVKDVANKEGKKVNNEIACLIADRASGSARNALTILEAVINMEEEAQKAYLEAGNDEAPELIEVCRTVADGNWPAIMKAVALVQAKYEAEAVRRAILGYLTGMLKKSCEVRIVKKCTYLLDPVYETGYNGLIVALGKCYLA